MRIAAPPHARSGVRRSAASAASAADATRASKAAARRHVGHSRHHDMLIQRRYLHLWVAAHRRAEAAVRTSRRGRIEVAQHGLGVRRIAGAVHDDAAPRTSLVPRTAPRTPNDASMLAWIARRGALPRHRKVHTPPKIGDGCAVADVIHDDGTEQDRYRARGTAGRAATRARARARRRCADTQVSGVRLSALARLDSGPAQRRAIGEPPRI